MSPVRFFFILVVTYIIFSSIALGYLIINPCYEEKYPYIEEPIQRLQA